MENGFNGSKRKLTYKDIKKLDPNTMTWEDREAVNEFTERTNRQTLIVQKITIALQLVAVLIMAYTYFKFR